MPGVKVTTHQGHGSPAFGFVGDLQSRTPVIRDPWRIIRKSNELSGGVHPSPLTRALAQGKRPYQPWLYSPTTSPSSPSPPTSPRRKHSGAELLRDPELIVFYARSDAWLGAILATRPSTSILCRLRAHPCRVATKRQAQTHRHRHPARRAQRRPYLARRSYQ